MNSRLVEALLEGDRAAAMAEVRADFRERGLTHVYEDLVCPALHRIGELWSIGRVSVADEHLATAIAQGAIAAVYGEVPWPRGGPKVIVAAPAGERHELPARMVADLLALDGWSDVFLGSDVPRADLVTKIRHVSPVFVAVSVTLVAHLAEARDLIASGRDAAPRVKFLVGGRAVRPLDRTVAVLGADAGAMTAREGVDVARGWKP
jgi:methanogenic corrinoid protein MtbC1